MSSVASDDLQIVSFDAVQFKTWFAANWRPGQHISVVGPTGTGKSVFVTNAVLPLRRWVMVLDPKGGDSTVAKLEQHGFVRSDWPPSRQVRKDIAEGKPARLIIGQKLQTVDDMPKLRSQMAVALRDSFNETGWTVYCDELQILADPRLMGLGSSIEQNLIAARDRNVSMVMSFQRPRHVPPSAGEMSTWFCVLYTRDQETVDILAEKTGRPRAEMRGLVKGLPTYCVLIFGRDPRAPIIVTKADAA